MIARVILIALLQVSSVWSASLTRLGGQAADGVASAVLSASGGGYMANKGHQATGPAPAPAQCQNACEVYQGGVDKDTEAVCMNAANECAPDGCGLAICHQTFETTCTNRCSEWATVDEYSLNVCQGSLDATKHKCTDVDGTGGACAAGEWRCKQPEIPDCSLFCEEYEQGNGMGAGNAGAADEGKVDLDSKHVCQNLDTADNNDKFGYCKPLPCNQGLAIYRGYSVCKQSYPMCLNKCQDTAPGVAFVRAATSSTVCYSKSDSTCYNDLKCGDNSTHTRCVENPVHQTIDVNKGGDPWVTAFAEKSAKAAEAAEQAAGRRFTQEEWRAEQQRWRKNALRQQTRRAVLRREELP